MSILSAVTRLLDFDFWLYNRFLKPPKFTKGDLVIIRIESLRLKHMLVIISDEPELKDDVWWYPVEYTTGRQAFTVRHDSDQNKLTSEKQILTKSSWFSEEYIEVPNVRDHSSIKLLMQKGQR